MSGPDLVQRVLSDPDNDVGEMVEAFVSRGDPIWYVDRHVFFEVPDDDELAEEAAVALACLWATGRAELADRSDVSVSKPYAIVDDEWLAGDRETAPSHVYIESLEELSTVGLGSTPNDITENDLRRERGLAIRVEY